MLVHYFKVLADENRLRIIGLLGNREYSVGELAAELKITEPTVSHHLSKLRSIGLVNLRASGTMRLYRLQMDNLRRFQESLQHLEKLDFQSNEGSNDMSWIDELNISDADRKVLKDYTYNKRLKQIPTKQKKLAVILRWLASQFEPDTMYTESEVNTIIRQFHDDYAGLRRDLVDYGFLNRESNGSTYWLTSMRA
ncbi:MAG TPA: metalloregulator ArsR/SmtB family transcription factor [Aggregatilineales bacterium]|nr:metalloregulator ArsR/SmtB family transcription factor [Aggregatilineales bacterium]